MLAYWFMFLIPAYAQFAPMRLTAQGRDAMLKLVCVVFTFAVGLRYQVGGDWEPYLDMYQGAVGRTLSDALSITDPGYALINWIAASLNMGIYAVNLTCAALFMSGVYCFCRRQPQPWLALMAALPYMIIVVAMGYTRQSVALGIELIALVALSEQRVKRYILLIACAGLFHKSAALLMPLGILVSTQTRLTGILAMSFMSALFGGALLYEFYESLWTDYVDAEMESAGGAIRVAMNSIPALLFLIFSKRLTTRREERRLWFCPETMPT